MNERGPHEPGRESLRKSFEVLFAALRADLEIPHSRLTWSPPSLVLSYLVLQMRQGPQDVTKPKTRSRSAAQGMMAQKTEGKDGTEGVDGRVWEWRFQLVVVNV